MGSISIWIERICFTQVFYDYEGTKKTIKRSIKSARCCYFVVEFTLMSFFVVYIWLLYTLHSVLCNASNKLPTIYSWKRLTALAKTLETLLTLISLRNRNSKNSLLFFISCNMHTVHRLKAEIERHQRFPCRARCVGKHNSDIWRLIIWIHPFPLLLFMAPKIFPWPFTWQF